MQRSVCTSSLDNTGVPAYFNICLIQKNFTRHYFFEQSRCLYIWMAERIRVKQKETDAYTLRILSPADAEAIFKSDLSVKKGPSSLAERPPGEASDLRILTPWQETTGHVSRKVAGGTLLLIFLEKNKKKKKKKNTFFRWLWKIVAKRYWNFPPLFEMQNTFADVERRNQMQCSPESLDQDSVVIPVKFKLPCFKNPHNLKRLHNAKIPANSAKNCGIKNVKNQLEKKHVPI